MEVGRFIIGQVLRGNVFLRKKQGGELYQHFVKCLNILYYKILSVNIATRKSKMLFYILHLNETFTGIIMLNQGRPFPTQYYIRKLAMQKVLWYGMLPAGS